MKKLLSILSIMTLSVMLFAQAPQSFSYQTVIRDASWTVLDNQSVGIKISILEDVANGNVVYEETHNATTSTIGLVNLSVGAGMVINGIFNTIDWGNHNYFIEVAVDVTGGTSYIVMGATQLRSVPYALYAKTSGTPGTAGPQGPPGIDGADGVDGNDGADGVDGNDGADGVDGNDGAVGATGPAGNDGVDGNDGAVGATGPAGNDGVDGMDAVVDYDSLANLISVDSTFIITVGGGMGGGCNWEFPDGLNGEPIIIGPTMVNGGTINYTVPIGSNLYITAMFSPNAGVEAKVNGMIITNAEMNTQYGVKNAGPWYLGEGDVLELGFEMTAFCLLVDAQVEPKTLSPNPNGYIIPSGKIFYLSEAFIEQSGGYVTVNGNEILIGYVNHASTNYLNPSGPWILKSGDILNTNGSTQTINGYLADENYFAGCGGGGSSSATSNATIDSLSQVVSHLDSSLTALTSLLTFGCTDASALNYDPIANTDNGLCTYAPLAIGNFYQGGIIFYLDGNGGGLVCLVNDINIDLEWGCWGYPMPGADGTAIGTGFQNTIDIVNANCSFGGNGIGIAANICENLTHEGYSDWFLPSKDELNQMFINKDIINLGSGIAFGSILGYTYYWSSTEGDDFNACLQDFTNGNQYCNAGTKYGVNGVRAIRAF